MKKIQDLRLDIDQIDKGLLELIKKRLEVAKEIGDVKRENGIGVIDRNREQEVLSRLIEHAKNKGIKGEIVKKIWKVLMEVSYEVEKEKNGNS